jgi:Ca-activated chloride channel family protein
LPTVGETTPARIIENVRSTRVQGVRLFTFGVGYDVNTALLDKLAAENKGTADYVEPKENLEIKVSNFFAKVNYPVLTDLALNMGGVETDLIYPRDMPDLFQGTQLTLIGRYRNHADLKSVNLRLEGKTNQNRREFTYPGLSFPLKEDDNDFLPRLWATRRVGWLMEQIRTNGEARELRDEVVDLGTRYGIVTPYTSYLALEPGAQPVTATAADAAGGARGNVTGRQVDNLPIQRRSSQSLYSVNPSAAKATTGEAAVQQSKRAREQQDASRVSKDELSSAVRSVGGKTFYLREGVWTDAEFKQDARLPETVLEFGSEAYFALLRREPRLAEFFSLGERVVVVLDGRVYRVYAAAP